MAPSFTATRVGRSIGITTYRARPCLPQTSGVDQRNMDASNILRYCLTTNVARSYIGRSWKSRTTRIGLCTPNVRTNHVHVVASAPETPERVMNTLKSWSTRRMVEAGVLPPGTKAWVRHGSTRYLWKPDQLEAACHYVCEGQGTDLDGTV